MPAPVALIVGPAEHGVVIHARRLAQAAGWLVVDDPADLPEGRDVVLDVTDRLFGATSDVSGPRLRAVAEAVHARRGRLVVSLHDVPFEGDGPVRHLRSAVYRDLVLAADGVLVASRTEQGRLAAIAPGLPRVAVVPLPVPPRVPAPARAHRGPITSVTVLGFLYPGKGHDEVLGAMAALPPTLPLVCVGRAADGHDDLVLRLRNSNRPVQVTGFVPEASLGRWLHEATVPVAPNRAVSASGSITEWWSHGRRPLVPDTPYARELAEVDPTCVVRYDDLAAALHAAVADPDSTWSTGATSHPTLATTVDRRASVLAGWWP